MSDESDYIHAAYVQYQKMRHLGIPADQFLIYHQLRDIQKSEQSAEQYPRSDRLLRIWNKCHSVFRLQHDSQSLLKSHVAPLPSGTPPVQVPLREIPRPPARAVFEEEFDRLHLVRFHLRNSTSLYLARLYLVENECNPSFFSLWLIF